MKVGFTIGKFAPFHNGHKYLIETAIKEMDEFYVVIYDTPELGINIETKKKWINYEFPNVKILQAFDSPKKYGLDDKSVKIQMEYLSDIVKDIPITNFYSSEEYGKYVSKYLKIENSLVDQQRQKYNIRANNIRKDIEAYKKYLPEHVYTDMKQIKRHTIFIPKI